MSNPLHNLSLNQIEARYRYGAISREQVRDYLREWNATPGRFSQAVLSDGAIRVFDPEKSGVFYRHLATEYGVKL